MNAILDEWGRRQSIEPAVSDGVRACQDPVAGEVGPSFDPEVDGVEGATKTAKGIKGSWKMLWAIRKPPTGRRACDVK